MNGNHLRRRIYGQAPNSMGAFYFFPGFRPNPSQPGPLFIRGFFIDEIFNDDAWTE
jgi:hypothetical protein